VLFETTFIRCKGHGLILGTYGMKIITRWLLFSVLLVVASCKPDPFRINTADIQADIRLDRFEKALFSVDPAAVEQYIPLWNKEYGVFFSHFCYLMGLGNIEDPGFPERLRLFITDHNNYLIYKRTLEVFPDLDTLTTGLEDAFRHFKFYFPDKPVPRIITYVAGFNQSAITDDSLLAVGLDRYLGKHEILYSQAGIYNYLLANMHPEKILSDCMQFWGETEFPFNDSINSLITQMIYQGRLLYFTHAMLPEQPDTLSWGFTAKDLAYFQTAEKSMWAYLVEKKLLFSSDRFTIDKFTLPGPFTKDFGRGSPARAAVWLGYRIVQSYMKRNQDVTFQALMAEEDYMKILNRSAYNP
jgi:hypothetical protein